MKFGNRFLTSRLLCTKRILTPLMLTLLLAVFAVFTLSCQKNTSGEGLPHQTFQSVMHPASESEVLFDFDSTDPGHKASVFEVNSNNNTFYRAVTLNGKPSAYLIWPSTVKSAATPGINPGENLEITVPGLDISPEKYENAALQFKYFCSTTSEDPEIKDSFLAYITTDKRTVTSYLRLAVYKDEGVMDYPSSNGSKYGIVYTCVSEDLFKYLPEGEKITSVTFLPYGEMLYGNKKLPQNGFRLVDLQVIGNIDYTAFDNILEYTDIVDIRPVLGIKSNLITNSKDERLLEEGINYLGNDAVYAVWANPSKYFYDEEKIELRFKEDIKVKAGDYSKLNIEMTLAYLSYSTDTLVTEYTMDAYIYTKGSKTPIETPVKFKVYDPRINFVTTPENGSEGNFYCCISDDMLAYLNPEDVITNIEICPYEQLNGTASGAFRLVDLKLVGQTGGTGTFLAPDPLAPEIIEPSVFDAPDPASVVVDGFPSIMTVVLILLIILALLVTLAYIFVII